MKFIRVFSCFLFLVTCCTSYGNENKYIFVGQNGTDEHAQMSFILELFGDNLENHVQINEDGEIYLKADKIVAVTKEASPSLANPATVATSFLASNQLNEDHEEREIACKKCRFYYTPRPGHRACPRCGTSN